MIRPAMIAVRKHVLALAVLLGWLLAGTEAAAQDPPTPGSSDVPPAATTPTETPPVDASPAAASPAAASSP